MARDFASIGSLDDLPSFCHQQFFFRQSLHPH
jgi:hypothetical protein